jgi:hypothetical protein
VGIAVPLTALALMALAPTVSSALAGLAAVTTLIGLLVYEEVWITAGQAVPMS